MTEKLEDLLNDETGEQAVTPTGDTEDIETDPLEEMKTQMEELKKQNNELKEAQKGLQGGISGLREEKNLLKEQHAKVLGLLESIQNSNPSSAVQKELDRIAVEFSEDDQTPFVPADKIEKFIEKVISKTSTPVQNKLNSLEEEVSATRAQTKESKMITSILEKDESFKPAYKTMMEQADAIDKILTEYVQNKGIDTRDRSQWNIYIARDLVYSPDLMKSFHEKYPGADPELILEARAVKNPRIIEKALKSIAESSKKKSEDDIDLSDVMDKPSSLATATGGKKGDDSIMDLGAKMSTKDFLAMSDEKYEQFKKRLGSGNDFL